MSRYLFGKNYIPLIYKNKSCCVQDPSMRSGMLKRSAENILKMQKVEKKTLKIHKNTKLTKLKQKYPAS